MTKPETPDLPLRIALAGATGAVGQSLAQHLHAAADQVRVWAWQRRDVTSAHDNWHALPFADGVLQAPVDAFVSALGTTLKQAGSKAAFRAVDVEAVLARATEARAYGARNAVVVSSVVQQPRRHRSTCAARPRWRPVFLPLDLSRCM